MKLLTICIVFMVFWSCTNNKDSQKREIEHSEKTLASEIQSGFEYHLNILDSVNNANPGDSIFACCSASIKFMEEYTGIEAHSDGTLLGKLEFSRSDLLKWHGWFTKKTKKK